MPKPIPSELKTYLAWTFDSVLPGTFGRNKAAFAHLTYPILAPLPPAGSKSRSQEQSTSHGPFIYFVCDDTGLVRYVGKSQEKDVVSRWVRPGNGGPSSHYWTHSIKSGGTVFSIAKALRSGESRHFSLRYVPVHEISPLLCERLGIVPTGPTKEFAKVAEKALMKFCCADWNQA